MKSTYYLLSAALIGLFTIAATSKNDSEVKVTVIKHKGLETLVLDTTFDESTGYTVEQFLIDNDLNPEKTEIIDTEEFNGKYTWKRNDSFLFLDGRDVKADLPYPKTIIVEAIMKSDKEELEELTENLEETEVSEEIYEVKKGNDKRGTTITTIVNGKKTTTKETIPSSKLMNMDDDGWKSNENIQEALKKLEIDIEGLEFDFEELQKTMRDFKIEFIEIEEVMKNDEIDFEALQSQFKTDVKVIVNGESLNVDSEDGSDSFQYIMTESNDRPYTVIEISAGKSLSGDENVFAEFEAIKDSEYTVAIVTRTNKRATIEDSDINNEEVFISDQANLPIEDLFYYPNPTKGQLRLEFFLPERGQTQVQIFDVQGRKVYEDNLGNFQGAFNKELDLSNLESGTYVMNIMQNNLRLAEKIIVN
ncbi:MAG: T9SS type A sorting domain-containing protein [Flavobacteriales bacterium]|nr:T9SS type A sorting domain-containing protein [Flavobacteriales bacterium]